MSGHVTRRAVSSAVLFLAVIVVYLANGRTIGAGDTRPAAYLPWSILRHQNFDLDEFPALYAADPRRPFPLLDGVPYYLVSRNGHYLSAYSPGPGVVAVPVYALPVLRGATPDEATADRLEKLTASIVTALSVVFLYWALSAVTSAGWSLAIALVYAFGTSSLSMSSQGLWQHGPSQLCIAASLWMLARGTRDARYLGYAGLPMAAAVAMRATDVLLVLPVAAWVLYAHRARALSLILWALPPAALMAAYHAAYFGVTDRGYGGTTAPVWALFSQMPLREGLPGVLVSPSRGLFVYSPVLLFSLIGMVAVWRGGPPVWRALSLGPPLVVLVIAKWLTWWGGHSWGPRLLGDIAPILCFFLYPVVPLLERRPLVRILFLALALWSAGAHGLGAWLYDRRWDSLITERSYARLASWRESPLAFYGREALARLGVRGVASAPAGATAGASGTFAASYAIDAPPDEVATGERFVVPASVRNAGESVWPAIALEDRGAVRLGWRWFRGETEVLAGREFLLSDVPAGRKVPFEVRVVAPETAGDYVLVIGLVRELVGWFDAPVSRRIRVVPRSVERLLAQPLAALGPAPAATIATDRPSYRPDGSLELQVTLRYPHRPRNLDAYLVLEGPDGRMKFFDGHTGPRPAGPAWSPWVRSLPLPARADGRFRVPLSGWPAGAYRWHVALTAPGGVRPLARSAAAFTIEP